LKYTVENEYSTFEQKPISSICFDTIQRAKFSELRVSIAEKKVIKIKTRVVKAFLDFSKNKNFRLA
jgi:hypothetical protein